MLHAIMTCRYENTPPARPHDVVPPFELRSASAVFLRLFFFCRDARGGGRSIPAQILVAGIVGSFRPCCVVYFMIFMIRARRERTARGGFSPPILPPFHGKGERTNQRVETPVLCTPRLGLIAVVRLFCALPPRRCFPRPPPSGYPASSVGVNGQKNVRVCRRFAFLVADTSCVRPLLGPDRTNAVRPSRGASIDLSSCPSFTSPFVASSSRSG